MKLLYLSNALLPSKTANSVHVMKMAEALVKHCDVTVVASRVKDTDSQAIFAYYDVQPTFKIQFVKTRHFKGASLLNAWVYYRAIKKIRPDVIYSRHLGALMSHRYMYLPIFYESHQPRLEGKYHRLESKLFKNPMFKKLIVITKALEQIYLKGYPSLEGHTVVLPDAANIPKTTNQTNVTDKETLTIGYVGHLYQGRGIDLILELAKHFSEIDFLIVGGEEQDVAYWRRMSAELKNIHFAGFVDQKTLPSYYQKMDIVLAPYQQKVSVAGNKNIDTSQWMSPLKIFEYMAYKKAIIASNLPVLEEVLVHEHNAILCSPIDVESWKNAIDRLVEDQTLRLELSKEAYQTLNHSYTWDKRASQVIQLIQKNG